MRGAPELQSARRLGLPFCSGEIANVTSCSFVASTCGDE